MISELPLWVRPGLESLVLKVILVLFNAFIQEIPKREDSHCPIVGHATHSR